MKWEHNYYDHGFAKFISDLIECIIHFWIHKRTLVCNIVSNYDVLQHKEYYIREEYWTDEKRSLLHETGYRTCEGLPGHDNLAWIGVPIMIKMSGFKIIESNEKDDPTFLNDRMNNNLLNKFARSLARAAMVAGMDIQKILLMAGVGIAAVVGMKLLGVF